LKIDHRSQIVILTYTFLPIELQRNADEVGDRIGELLGYALGIARRLCVLSP
jgi:hypothetical protein